MKRIVSIVVAVIATIGMFSCNKVENTVSDETILVPNSPLVTKAAGGKTPSILCYIETNDVNPLNAGCCRLPNGDPFIDYVVLFAANIHKETVGSVDRPTLYFNNKLCPIMQNYDDYIAPLQEDGQKVLLGVLGDWEGLSLSNMTTTQAEQFATILAYVVECKGLDGVAFDDEYSGSNVVNNYSYSTIINKYRELRPYDIIHVFDWGGTYSISSTAAASIDFAGHGYFSSSYYLSTSYSSITGMNNARWSPISLNLGSSYSSTQLTSIQTKAASAYTDGYGQILLFNMRTCEDVCHKPVMQAIATGRNWGTLYCEERNEALPNPVDGGCTVTYDMAINGCN